MTGHNPAPQPKCVCSVLATTGVLLTEVQYASWACHTLQDFQLQSGLFGLFGHFFFPTSKVLQGVNQISLRPKTVPEMGLVEWGLNWVRINGHAEPRAKHRRPRRQFIDSWGSRWCDFKQFIIFVQYLDKPVFYQSWVDIAELSQVWIVLSLYILFLAVTKQKFSIDLGFITVNRTIKLIKYAQKFWIWGAISASMRFDLGRLHKSFQRLHIHGKFLASKAARRLPMLGAHGVRGLGKHGKRFCLDRKSLSRMLHALALASSDHPWPWIFLVFLKKNLQLCYKMNDKGQQLKWHDIGTC